MNPTTTPSQASIYQQLRSHLATLKLTAAAEALPGLLDESGTAGWSVTETLARILSVEVGQAEARRLAGRLRFANLPVESRLENFNLDYAQGIDRSLLNELGTCRWIDTAANLLLIGPPGVGKTHLAAGLGGPRPRPDTASISRRPLSWRPVATRRPSRDVGPRPCVITRARLS